MENSENKNQNSEKTEKDDKNVISKNKNMDIKYFDWIFDREWLRIKK